MSLREAWVSVPGFVDSYSVSNLGRVRSDRRVAVDSFGWPRRMSERILSPFRTKPGTDLFVSLCKDSKPKLVGIHRLVAAAFLPNPDCFKYVIHKNGVRLDNRVENLAWRERKEKIPVEKGPEGQPWLLTESTAFNVYQLLKSKKDTPQNMLAFLEIPRQYSYLLDYIESGLLWAGVTSVERVDFA